MNAPEADSFIQCCAAVARAAHDRNIAIAKVPGEHAVVISGNGSSAKFPIVSDEEDWLKTTLDEALFVVVSDAYAWYAASPDDAKLGALKDAPTEAFPAIKREWNSESSAVNSLATFVGGMDELKKIWIAAGFIPAAA